MKKLTILFSVCLAVLSAAALTEKTSASHFVFDLANLRETDPAATLAYDKINIQPAWEFIKNAAPLLNEVILGVVDGGLDLGHPEFAGVNTGQAVQRGIRPDSHGSAVTGIIGANNISSLLPYIFPHMNGIVSGVLASNKYVVGVSDFGDASTRAFGSALNDLIVGGAKIINLSLGAAREGALIGFTDDQKLCANVFPEDWFQEYSKFFGDYFQDRSSTTFIVAAGNQNVNVQDAAFIAQARDLSNVIIVGGSTLNDARLFAAPSGSNFGVGVALAAPAENVYAPATFASPLDIGDYWHPQNNRGSVFFPPCPFPINLERFFEGTSASAPMVTGVAAILKSIKPELTPAEIKDILMTSADPIITDQPLGSGCFDPINNPQGFTGCRLNALKAVQALLQPKLKILKSIPIEINPVSIKLSPDASRIYAVNSNPGTSPRQGSISVIDTSQNSVLTVIRLPANPNSAQQIALTPDGKKAYVAVGNRVDVVNLITNSFEASIPFSSGALTSDVQAIAINHKFAYVTDRNISTVSVIDIDPVSPIFHQVVTTIGPSGFSEPYGIAVSPDGTRAYVANRGNSTLTVIDTATNTLVGSPIPHNLTRGFSFTQVAVSPNGTKVFVVDRGDDSRIAVIDPISRAVSFIPTPGSGLVDVIVAPDGTAVLVTAQFSNQLFLIDINPQSPTYQQVLQEVAVPLAGFIAFRGLPDAFAYVTGGGASGQVFVVGE
ncbi:MAG: S8 family serine peptidase [bacterium]|nr:S8 family serine peptidase [bacterium]